MGWNLPDGVTDWDIDEAAGGHTPCDHMRAKWNAAETILECGDCGAVLHDETEPM